MLQRLTLMKIHALLAAIILPVAIMFFVTGALYTWGIKGSNDKQQYTIDLQQPLKPHLDALMLLAKHELATQGLGEPSGHAKIKQAGTSFYFEWTGASHTLAISPMHQPQKAAIKIEHATWYRHLVQLHKAKGGDAFKVYAAFMATALMLILLSGFVMAWQTPKLQKLTITASLGSLVLFAVMVALS